MSPEPSLRAPSLSRRVVLVKDSCSTELVVLGPLEIMCQWHRDPPFTGFVTSSSHFSFPSLSFHICKMGMASVRPLFSC